ncbi:hypothetical protein V0288_05020 [Pannus brasiliensis CCIBt3594]|uniref:Uncharacterized protein n=1 Tax=Pannus brasiliensis CCIBt3594 TaxID=1427578 RepID=A0AAW9QSL2_9CHRO
MARDRYVRPLDRPFRRISRSRFPSIALTAPIFLLPSESGVNGYGIDRAPSRRERRRLEAIAPGECYSS